MNEEGKPPTLEDRQRERQRCGVCGLPHPFLEVCPFVAEREVRVEFGIVDGKRRARTRVERTRYFERPELFKALQDAMDETTPEAAAAKPRRTRKT